MDKIYVDELGLTYDLDNIVQYCELLDLPNGAMFLTTEAARLTLLAKLIEGVGITIITGPIGVPFWSLVSPEVEVIVEPDGYIVDVGAVHELPGRFMNRPYDARL